MNISREKFVGAIESIVKQMDRDREISKSLDAVVKDGANHSLVYRTPLIEDMVKLLDCDDIISWWLWDGPEAGKEAEKFAIYIGSTEEGKRLPIHNAGELYDYMELIWEK